MVSMIVGQKGSGKTKRMINLANDDVERLDGNIVYIDDDNGPMYDLNHDIRFMSMQEYPIATKEEFFGFVCGIISNNYDIQKIYIDGFLKVVDIDFENMKNYFAKYESLAEKNNVKFVFSLNKNKESLPASIHKYII